MLIDSVGDLERYSQHQASYRDRSKNFKEVLLVDPDGFDITYAINDFMYDTQGTLNHVNHGKARLQWDFLKATLESQGVKVSVLQACRELPDLVFCANQSLPLPKGLINQRSVVISNMYHPERRSETALLKDWYQTRDFRIFELPTDVTFEGNGDAVFDPRFKLMWGGHGIRSSLGAYQALEKIIDWPIVPLRIQDPVFYHLDTCFAIINADTALVMPEAFEESALAMMQYRFKNLIRVDSLDNRQHFICNGYSPDGKHFLVQPSPSPVLPALEKLGIKIIPIETGEFIKSGGSVFCLKMDLCP